MRSLGAYIGRRNPGSGSGPNDQDSPSTEQLPVYQPAGPGIDDVIRTGEAGTGTATGDQSEAGREPAPVIAIGDQSATYKPATLHIDDNDGEAGTYTAIGDQNEGGREPAPIPPVIASGDQSATDNGSTPVYKPAYKPATSHIDDIFRTGEAGTGTATSDQNEAGREPAPTPRSSQVVIRALRTSPPLYTSTTMLERRAPIPQQVIRMRQAASQHRSPRSSQLVIRKFRQMAPPLCTSPHTSPPLYTLTTSCALERQASVPQRRAASQQRSHWSSEPVVRLQPLQMSTHHRRRT